MKENINIGAIGHVDHGKTTLSASIVHSLESKGITIAQSIEEDYVEEFIKIIETPKVPMLDFYYGNGPTATHPVRTAEKIGRNEDCPCGTGKKYKKCCINKKL